MGSRRDRFAFKLMAPNSEKSCGVSPRIQKAPSGSKLAEFFCASTGSDNKTRSEARSGFIQRRKAVDEGTKDVFLVPLVFTFVSWCARFLSMCTSESGDDCGS